MGAENYIILAVLGALCGLFALRIIKNKKIYDVFVLIVLVICIITTLPIGNAIPNSVLLVVALGIAVVAILFLLKSKRDALREAEKIDATSKENTKND